MKFKIFFLIFVPVLCFGMSLEEKIGQLFIIGASSEVEGDYQKAEEYITKHNVGGVLFVGKGGLWQQQRELTQHFQSISKIPLFIAFDGETGLGFRLSNVKSFPKNRQLADIKDEHVLFLIGREIGRQCRVMGITMNFAPVVDVNTNPNNPIIGDRSFGDDPIKVAEKALQVMKGMQSRGILTCAKHFPGHGDTSVDSHIDLPVVDHMELYPFQQLINKGVDCVMVAHLKVLGYEDPVSSLSQPIVTKLLKKEMRFKGLVIPDALNMKALTNYYSNGEIAVQAFLAGNDILLYPEDFLEAVSAIQAAVNQGVISEEDIDKRVSRILEIKEKLDFSFLDEEIETVDSLSLLSSF